MRSFKKLSLRQSLWAAALVLLVGATLYPSDMDGHYAQSRNGQDSRVVTSVEAYGRHVNTLIPVGTALVLRDIRGLGQIAAVMVAGTAATHVPKRLLNDIEIGGTRLGQRPNGGQHNMPSGHSALASAGAWIAVQRYLKLFGMIVWPILFLTMYARYMLDAHTISATIAGAIIGILVADLFTRPCFRLRRIFATRPSALRQRLGFTGKAPVSA
ncbi:phosphatase PAP2 family protein [Tateyamaria sp. syn59]|uniref:phosphatase PAP2 family protein n=1 Tax=Tateyamaria sp. syn59 TaxID=2576942 RepID=UPI0011BE6D64|nr:phosphatase PAP2 family protein [Tateyamaria sp. syn59]